jgi:serine/threonine-protein kinase
MNAPAAFGTYRVFHQTGNGVQGPVFRAFDSRQDRLVAIKAFTVDLVPARVVQLADSLRELVAASASQPAGLVPLIGVGIEGTVPFLVMECQTGEGLDVLLRRTGPLSVEEAAPILAGIASAIDRAAEAGLAHGGLHPRDVFVGNDRAVRVNGFGIVQAFERAGVPMPVRRSYAAPECGGAWDIRADVYSLGVITHELLTGVRPARRGEQDGSFVASTTPAQRVQLRRVLAKALEANVDERYSTGAAFSEALMAVTHLDRPLPVEAPLEFVPPPAFDAGLALRERPAISRVLHEPIVGDEPSADPDVIRPVEPAVEPAVPAAPRRVRTSSRAALAAVAAVTVAVGSSVTWFAFRTSSAAPVVSSAVAQVQPETRETTDVQVDPAPPAAVVPEPAPEAERAEMADARPAVARTNRLHIRSEPSGALVTIDGRLSGATPTTVRALSPGTYVVRVARPGHVPREERVTLAQATVRTLNFELEPGLDPWTSSLGSVDVDSRPRGAEVIIDGRRFGRTPLRAPALKPGVHDVRLALGGYASAAQQVDVSAGHRSTVNVTLQSLVR